MALIHLLPSDPAGRMLQRALLPTLDMGLGGMRTCQVKFHRYWQLEVKQISDCQRGKHNDV